MTRIKFSEHAKVDREERIVRIATTIGFGETVASFPMCNQHGETTHFITDTGVVIIKDRAETRIITMFAVSENALFTYWKTHKHQAPPHWLVNVVRNNRKKRKFLFEFQKKC